MTRKTSLVFAPLLACALVITACSSSGHTSTAAAKPIVVVVKDMAFTPSTITITPGQMVEWDFEDIGVPHDVNGDDGLNSPLQASGTYTHIFKSAGTFKYLCTVHPEMMKGEVVVK
jgi:plastocyanin